MMMETESQILWILTLIHQVSIAMSHLAELHLEKMKSQVPEGQLELGLATGWLYLGDEGRAMQRLKKAEAAGMKASGISMSNRELGAMLETEEYKNLEIQEY